MTNKALFLEAVGAATNLPEALRENAKAVTGLKEHKFDKSYIEFLDEQILLSPRGPEWTEILKRRREALIPFCGVRLLRCGVQVNNAYFSLEIHPETRRVVHWEEWECTPEAS